MTADRGGEDAQYVFLICSERCGSNLIATILGAHSKVHSPPPYHFGRDVILNLHLRDSRAGWDVVRGQLLERVRALSSEAAAMTLAAWMDEHPQAPAAEFARFVYAGLERKPGATTVFVKENNLHRLLFFVLHCFPAAKFVFQVRDPRDYLLSAEARRGFWAGNKFGSLRHALEVWRADQLGGLQAFGLLGPDRVYFQRYEDLVSRPREVLAPLCRFLGLPFEESMLDFYASDHAARRGASDAARANVARPLMSSNFGKYRAQLPRRKIRVVEAWLGDLMDRLGYERDHVRRGDVSKLRAVWPQWTEPFERLLNRETGPFYLSGQKRLLRRLRNVAAPLTPPYDASTRGP
ncbi:MAG: sulfotransferase domain protein [Steroidobacteraceae bacterium]|nr:sulfotransferase domain protein [Steroidobacteraceae bacterium]